MNRLWTLWNELPPRRSASAARKKRNRRAMHQSLEARELLTASMEIYDGGTQLSCWASDSFGSVTVGDTASKTLTISNAGDEALEVDQPSDPSGFSVQGAFPLSIDPGNSATCIVSLDTSAANSYSDELDLYSNDPTFSPFVIYLDATVNPPPPVISVLDAGMAVENDPYGYGMNPDDFGSTPEGTPVDKTFTIANSGPSDVALTAGSLSLPQGFSLAGAWPDSVPADGSATFTVQLDATSIDTPNGELSFSDSDPGGGFYQFAISGTVVAPPPVITVSDAGVAVENDPYGYGMNPDDFGTTPMGTPVDKVFTISNSSSSDVAITADSLSLPQGFSLVGPFPASVPAGGSTTFTVQLDASSIDTPNGELSFSDGDPGGGFYQFAISGTVVAPPPVITVLDADMAVENDPYGYGMNPVDFGTTSMGTPVDQIFTISNSSASDVALTAGSLSLPQGYSLVGAWPDSVPADGSANFTVQLDASSIDTPGGELSFSDGDPGGGLYQFAISGTVVAPPPVITVYDGSSPVANDVYGYGMDPDDFGGTPLGTLVDKTFAIGNSSGSDVAIASGSLILPQGFSLVGSFPSNVSAHGSTPFTVRFNAADEGEASGELSFTDGDPGGNFYQFAISGTALVPSISLDDDGSWLGNGATDDFGTTDQGAAIQRTMTITNEGQAPLTLTPTSLVVPTGFSLVGAFPTSVAAGGAATFTVRLDASAAGTDTGALSFATNDPANNPFSVTLTGVVNPPSGAISVTDAGVEVVDGESQLDFGTTDAGTPVDQTLLIRNTGPAPLTLDSQTLLLPAGFSVATPFAASVAPGASTTLVIALSSAQGGDFGGLASFNTGDPSHHTFSFFVTGCVNAPEPAIEMLDGATTLYNGGGDDFGSTSLGVVVRRTLTIENQGNAALSLDAHSLLVPDGFSVVTPFAASVAPGASTTLVIQLDAATGGDFAGALDFSTDDPNNSDFSLNLTGEVLAPAMTVLDGANQVANNSGTVDFGSTPLGSAATHALTIENTGAADLMLDPLSLSLPAGYSLVSGFASDVPPGGSTSLTLQLNATSTGQVSGPVSFRDGDPNNSTFSFAATGTVDAAAIQVLDGAATLSGGVNDNFGDTTLGAPLEQTLTINDIGLAPLTLDPASLVMPLGFSVVTPFAASVEPGGSTTLVVRLDAAAAGNYAGLMTFTDNDPNTQVFKLHLSGIVEAPALEVRQSGALLANGASIALGTTSVGSPIETTLLIGNAGSGSLSLDTASLSLPAGFTAREMFDASVAPASGTQLVIALTATAAGTYSGTLSFTSNDPSQSPFELTLSGVVTAPILSVLAGATTIAAGATEDVGATPVGTDLVTTLSVENLGTAPLAIDTANIVLPAGFSLLTAPDATIAAGGSSTMVVQLDASTAGVYSGAMIVPTNDPSRPAYSFTLSGRVLLSAATLAVLEGAASLADGDTITFPATQTGLPQSATLTLENLGYPSLSLDTSSLSLPAGYSVVTPFAGNIAGGGSTTLVVRLDAADAGSFSGELAFNYGTDPNNPDSYDSSYSLALSGTVAAPAAVMSVRNGGAALASGGRLDFPAAIVGAPTTETLEIDNAGAGALNIDTGSIVVPAGFSVLTPPEASVAAGGSTSMVLQLDAAAAGDYLGVLSFDDNDQNQPTFSLTLSGAAAAPQANISVIDVLGGHAQIANGGADAFASTSLGTPGYALFGIQNTGSDALSLDPASLVLPVGFSLYAPFDASVPAGGETTVAIRLDAATGGTFAGPVSFAYNDGQDQTYSFTISADVTAPVPVGISVDNFGLANGLGPAAALTAADPTLSGEIDGTFNDASVVVEFDANGDGASDGQTAAVIAAGGGFTFDPRAVDSALTGYLGPVDLKYRAEITDAAGNVTYGDWTDFAFTMVAAPTNAHVDGLALANDTGDSSSDLLTYDPRVSGRVGGPFVGASVDVQFVVGDGAGNPAGTMPGNPIITGAAAGLTVAGQNFTYNPIDDDPALAYYAGPVTLYYRPVERDAGGAIVYTGDWTALGFTLYAPTIQASVSNLHLIDDTGASNTDLITTDPRLAGTVTGTFTQEIVEVEFSLYGDGQVDGMVAATAVGTDFSYDPRQSDASVASYAGALPLEYRTVEFDGRGGKMYGAWASFPITLVQATTSAVIDNLRLANVTGAAGPPPTSSDASVTGTVVGAQLGGAPQVQFDYNGDGIANETVTANSDGTFSDSLPGLPYGEVTLGARTVEFDSTQGIYLYGAWQTLNFTFAPPPPPGVASLSLVNVTDVATGGTSDPAVSGQLSVVSGQGSGASGQLVEVQFDTNGDGQPDATTLADMQGGFSFTPLGLSYGSVTVSARTAAVSAGPLTYSPWSSLTFTYEAPPAQAPAVNDFRLSSAVGAGSPDPATTSDPTVTGTVAYLGGGEGASGGGGENVPTLASIPKSVDFLTVEFDYNGDGTPDASTTTGAGGMFTFKPTGLAYGSVTIRARAVGNDRQPGGGQDTKVYGDWTSLSFTYQQAAANIASVSSLVLAAESGGGGEGASGSTTTSDPTVSGQLSAAGGQTASATAVSFLTVEFDTNGDGVPDANVRSDAQGNFTFKPSGLSYGPVTIAARVRRHDYDTGGFDYSAWTTLSFTYQAPAGVTAPSIASLTLLDDSGASASDGLTANPAIRGVASAAPNPESPTPTAFVQIDVNGDGVPDGFAWPDANGNFTYAPTSLAYGAVTIAARPVGWASGSGASGQYLYGAWTTLSFTYQQQAAAAPAIAALGLIDASGALNTQVTADTTSSQPVVGGQLTYQGSVAGLAVELDVNGDGVADATATTDQYGDFSLPLSGLAPGAVTVDVRASAVDDATKQTLLGAWIPLTFTYVAPTIALPTISGLALADDTGVSNTDKVTTDPTVSGQWSVVSSPLPTDNGQLTTDQIPVIQFDTNGDGVPDGTTVADGAGNFSWTPTGLAAGQVTVAARAVDDDAAGNPVAGDWVSLSFTLAVAAPAAGTIVASIAPADNVGPSSTALISTDGAITGQVAAPPGSTASVAGVSVQIDYNGDGLPDATVTTDSTGKFSYTPPAGSLPQGEVKIEARTSDQAQAATTAPGMAGTGGGEGASGGGGGSGSVGAGSPAPAPGWAGSGFVVSTNPSDPGVQAQAEQLGDAIGGAEQAATDGQSATDGAQDTLDGGQATAAGAYDTAVAQAEATQEATTSAAQTAYNAALAAAQDNYQNSLSLGAAYAFNLNAVVVAAPLDFSVVDDGYVIPGDDSTIDGFGVTTEGSPITRNFTLVNDTADDVGLSGLSLPDGFSLVGAFPSTAPAGGTASFTVEFDASSSADAAGALSFNDTADGGGQYSFTIGAAAAPASEIKVSDAESTFQPDGAGLDSPADPASPEANTDDFGATTEGQAVEKTFTITNASAADLALGALSLPAGFSLIGQFPADVPAGGTATFTVAFDAQAAGAAGGVLSIGMPAPAAYQPYAWPDAPPSLPAPDETPAESPVEAPSFDGAAFDPNQDPAYTSAIQIDQQTYDSSVSGANEGYASDESVAASQEQNTLYGPGGARETEQDGFNTADNNYQTAMEDPSPPNPTDLDTAMATLRKDDGDAVNTYNIAFRNANNGYLSAMSSAYGDYTATVYPLFEPHDQKYRDAEANFKMPAGTSLDPDDPGFEAAYSVVVQEIADAYHAVAVAEAGADNDFAVLVDKAAKVFDLAADAALAGHDGDVADALLTEQQTLDADQATYQKSCADWLQWQTTHQAQAVEDRQKAYDLAEKGFALAQAKATQTYNDSVALAAQKRDDKIADALELRQTDDALALGQAGQDYLGSVTAAVGSGAGIGDSYEIAWAGYQSGLAGDEAAHEENDATIQHTMAHTEDQAAYLDATAVDLANEGRDETLATDRWTEQDAEATAQGEMICGDQTGQNEQLKGQADNDHTRAYADIAAWQNLEDGMAGVADKYDKAFLAAQQVDGDALAVAAQAESDGFAGAQLKLVNDGDQDAYNAKLNDLAAAWWAAVAGAGEQEGDSAIDAYEKSVSDPTGGDGPQAAAIAEAYNDNLADDKSNWSKQNDALEGADELAIGTALATQDQLDAAARDDADGTAANQAAIEVGKDAVAEQGYNDADAGYQETQDIDDAEAQQTFEETEADDYAAAMQTWSDSVNPNPQSPTPLGASATEQYQQAAADDAWVHSVTTAQVLDVQGVDGAQVGWTATVDAAAELQTSDDADAVAAAIVAGDNADKQEAIDRDTAWTTEVQNLSGAVTSYDQSQADAEDDEVHGMAKAKNAEDVATSVALGDYFRALAAVSAQEMTDPS